MEQSVEEFGALFARFLQDVVSEAPSQESALAQRLRRHLGVDPLAAPLTSMRLAPFEHPDMQVALDAYATARGRSAEVIGVMRSQGMSFTQALMHARSKRLGAPRYVQRAAGLDRQVACLSEGIVLVDSTDAPPHSLVVTSEEHGPFETLALDVLSPEPSHGRAVLDEIRALMTEHSVYRGQVLTLGAPRASGHGLNADFLPRPEVDRDGIVLPEGLLERIERRTVRFDEVAERFAAQGLSRKRGVLLYGPPGTGKTLTVQYLIGRMIERTVVVLTGQGLGAIGPAAALARRLQPAMLVLEDVDLVAHDRSLSREGNPVLFELLNALDGLGEDDGDIVVVLTTNRADLLEPALAARPGRVDLAVELPLPVAAEQTRLLALYTAQVPHDVDDWSSTLERIDGTPASFIGELVRTAALLAADRDAQVVSAGDVAAAVDELLGSGPLTAALLGARWGTEEPAVGPGPSAPLAPPPA